MVLGLWPRHLRKRFCVSFVRSHLRLSDLQVVGRGSRRPQDPQSQMPSAASLVQNLMAPSLSPYRLVAQDVRLWSHLQESRTSSRSGLYRLEQPRRLSVVVWGMSLVVDSLDDSVSRHTAFQAVADSRERQIAKVVGTDRASVVAGSHASEIQNVSRTGNLGSHMGCGEEGSCHHSADRKDRDRTSRLC